MSEEVRHELSTPSRVRARFARFGATRPTGNPALEPLMAPTSRPEHGQLIPWHGAPGTGKTYALRALAWEWRSWCRLHYVTDPEVFFGENAKHMLNVLLEEPEDDERELWRLLILEDTGELLVPMRRSASGRGCPDCSTSSTASSARGSGSWCS